MRAAKDPDILEALAKRTAFVCFSPRKDRFFTVAFDSPDWSDWLPDRDKEGKVYVEDWASGVDVSLHAAGGATVQFFEGDMADQTLVFRGGRDLDDWRAMHAHYASNKPVISESDLYFYGSCTGRDSREICSLTIDQAEVKMDESYSGNHWLIIRRSTKKFVETVGNKTVTGQCLEFRKKGAATRAP